MRKQSPATIIALLALFVALGGVGVAATGDNFILGNSNSTTSVTGLTSNNAGKALSITQQSTGAGATALGLTVPAGKPPFTVSSATKVVNLNADQFDGRDSTYFLPKTGKAADSDKLDGLDSTGFLRDLVPLSLTGSTATDGVIVGTNTGSANGVQGLTGAAGASGVYGQNDGAGYGVAGRANGAGGVGVYAESTAGGPALQIHTAGAPPMLVDSAARVDNLNADKVDGASILSNRIISTTPNDHILQMPGFGDVNVNSCNHTNSAFDWSSGGPNAYVTWWDLANPGNGLLQGVFNIVNSGSRPRQFVMFQLARNTGGNTSIATVTVTTNASDCVFAAQAVVQPG